MRIAKAGHEGPKASSAVTATDDSRSATGVSRRQAYAMWGMGMAGYLFAITCRSSFAASGIVAAQHFGVSSAALSSFVYLQLLMYAIMQIPAGILLDSYGAKRLIGAGCLLMSVGQCLVALSPTIAFAVLGRAFVGGGDALVFISVIRLVAAWFPLRQLPLMNQLTGQVGGVGQLISLYPFAWLLHLAGWERAFLLVAAIGVLIAVGVFMGVHDTPQWRSGNCIQRQGRFAAGWRNLVEALKSTATWCGFWIHAVTWFPSNMLNQLWGLPFLIAVEHFSPGQASSYLAVGMVLNVVWAIVLGRLAGIHPLYGRAVMVYVSVGLQILLWTLVLLTPGPHHAVLLGLLIVALASGGPCANIALDFARDGNSINSIGSATGFANTGGFVSSAIVLLGVGALLDMQGASDPSAYTSQVMRVATLVQYPVWAIGLIGFSVTLPAALRTIRKRFLTLREV
ncbi:MFS transporter [Bifidobacterium subtile]|jgi:predicted MFS family arabinose efflux permease|uniref:MFS transporter n=1 Tax=Bifidobacterium subtile TaxID=77635 RepID=UPI002F358CB7